MSGVGSSPALATCETRQVLLAGVSGVFPGNSRFAPPIDWLVSMSEIILKGTLNLIKKKKILTEAVLTYTQNLYVLFKNKKNTWTTIFHLKVIVFTAMKNCSILHRHVIVMSFHAKCVCSPFQDHIFKLMKSDSYSRYLRSDMYKEFMSGTRKKVRLLLPSIASNFTFKHT